MKTCIPSSPSLIERPEFLPSARRAPLATKPRVRSDRWRWTNTVAAMTVALTLVAGRATAEPVDTWTPLPLAANAIKAPNDLLFANGKYWAVGTEGKVQSSANGIDWTVVQTPTAKTLVSITHGNGLFVATGYGMTILTSPNGTDWTIREENAAKSIYSFGQVLFANGKFFAFSSQASAAVTRVSDNGITWTSGLMNGSKFSPSGAAWGNGLYVVVGSVDGSYTVQTSPDGLNWTRRSTAFTTGLDYVAYFKGLFVAGGTTNAPVLATSPDGITWTKIPNLTFPAADTEFWGIKVLNDRVFAFGDYGLLMSSTNGSTWVTHTTGTADTISEVDYNGSALYVMRRSENPAGAGPMVSAPWAPAGSPVPPGDTTNPLGARIANLSSRAWVGTNDAQFIAGFVIKGSTPKKVLVRAVGPTLGTFGVPGVLADPQLRIVNSGGTDVASNNDWSASADSAAIVTASASVGAFALPAGSKDAVSLVTLQPGSYSIVISGVNNGTGVALVEVYDLESPGACKLINIASREFVGAGEKAAFAGFVISGSAPRKLLIRGVGPTLGAFGIPGAITDPRIAIYDANQVKIAENDNWSAGADAAEIQVAAAKVGAFALSNGTADAALLVTLAPGAYTVMVNGASEAMTGVGLVEVYEVL